MNQQNAMVGPDRIAGLRFGLPAIAFVLIAAFVAGCSTTPAYPPAPGSLTGVDYNYHIGPSDVVNVIVWRNPELSMSVPVRPDGKITTPLIDDLDALGKTPTELERDMEKALVKYIRDPVVTVIVTSFDGPHSEQVRVIGEAAKPQVLPYRKDMTVLDVMIAAGGLTDFADGNSATDRRVVRRRQALQRPAARPDQARGHHRERRHASRRHPDHSAKLVLASPELASSPGKVSTPVMQEILNQALGYLRGMWHRRWIGLAVAWLIALIGVGSSTGFPRSMKRAPACTSTRNRC